MAARSSRHDGARQMFMFLMEEEEKHRVAIVAQIARMAEGNPPARIRGAAVRRSPRLGEGAPRHPGAAVRAAAGDVLGGGPVLAFLGHAFGGHFHGRHPWLVGEYLSRV